MALFSKKRSDGKVVKDGDPMMRVMPYIMRGRNESAVYYSLHIDVGACQEFIKKQRREGVRITLLNLVVAAMLQTMYRRPHTNRFIVGRRLYQRKQFEVLLVVKEALSDDAFESVIKVPFAPEDTVFEVADKMAAHIKNVRAGVHKTDDKLIRFFSRTPRLLNRILLSLLRFLDFHNILPPVLRDVLPFYSSIFISHLGSIGAGAPFHHLYEFGTTSIFMTIGRSYERPAKKLLPDGTTEVEWRKTVDLSLTVDERICDGYYLIKTMKVFQHYLNNPAELVHPVMKVDDDTEVEKQQGQRRRWYQWRFRRGDDILTVDELEEEEETMPVDEPASAVDQTTQSDEAERDREN